MTTLQLMVAVIGLLVGFGTQAYNTGSLFGQITVPKPWLPWVGLFVTFATGFVGVLSTASALSAGLIEQAVIAGFGGWLAGTTTHVGLNAHRMLMRSPSNDNAASAPQKAA